MAKKKPAATPPFRNRVVGLQEVRAADLVPADWNWRTHSDHQRAAVMGSLKELGITVPLNAWRMPDGRLQLWDGHLREDIFLAVGPDTPIPVIVNDFTEAEARKANLIHDPTAAMADADADKLEELLASVSTDDEAVQQMLDDLGSEHGVGEQPDVIELDTTTPPAMSWVLVGIETVRFGEIAAYVERIAEVDGIVCETTVSNARDSEDGQP